jgi:sugar phosphate isomerase/epimerase
MMKNKGIETRFASPVGLQLWSLRAEFARDGVPQTLKKIAAQGFRYVELVMNQPASGINDIPLKELRQVLLDHGLNPLAATFPPVRFRDDIDSVIRESADLGLTYAMAAWVPHEGVFSEHHCREGIRIFNQAARSLSESGIQFAYHPHGFEFQPFGDATLFDLMMRETDPQHVHYEMDVYWFVCPGMDPVKYLYKYGPRWKLMHLKDIQKGVPTGVVGSRPDKSTSVALGTGQVDWPTVLKAASEIGIKYYLIEDESPLVEQQIPVSLEFLKNVSW